LAEQHFAIGPEGKVALPSGPGLGITLNRHTVETYRARGSSRPGGGARSWPQKPGAA
jgi:L-alanine-DL-glutamate epimerase-like enolase superfamily enzyme